MFLRIIIREVELGPQPERLASAWQNRLRKNLFINHCQPKSTKLCLSKIHYPKYSDSQSSSSNLYNPTQPNQNLIHTITKDTMECTANVVLLNVLIPAVCIGLIVPKPETELYLINATIKTSDAEST